MTTAGILSHVKNPVSQTEAISFLIKFPRIIEPEVLRHRALSPSAESSRARNIDLHIADVENNPFSPDKFPKEHRGMMNYEWVEDESIRGIWNKFKRAALKCAKDLQKKGVHKAIASRPLQPVEYQTMILSGTQWSNFFYLRCPHYSTENGKIFHTRGEYLGAYRGAANLTDDAFFESIDKNAAQPEIKKLAEMMYAAFLYSAPVIAEKGKWYGPYMALDGGTFEEAKVAAAKCARISYNSKKVFADEENTELFKKLMVRETDDYSPRHPSPTEHLVMPMTLRDMSDFTITRRILGKKFVELGACYNLRGFIPMRYVLENWNSDTD